MASNYLLVSKEKKIKHKFFTVENNIKEKLCPILGPQEAEESMPQSFSNNDLVPIIFPSLSFSTVHSKTKGPMTLFLYHRFFLVNFFYHRFAFSFGTHS